MLFKSTEFQSFRAGDATLLKEIFHPKNNGVEVPYSLASGYLEEDESSLPHVLQQSETYFVISGQAEIYINDESFLAGKGDCVFVEKGAKQSVKNIGNSKFEFICIVSPPWTESGEEIL